MLDLAAVDSFYGNSMVLENISLSLKRGGFVSVLGRNGVGKTALMRTIMGLTDRVRGTIRIGDRDIANRPTFERARMGIAYVPQGRGIITRFTVRENLTMGGFASGGRQSELLDRVLEMFPYIRDNMHRRGGDLSGGQQQQLAIVRALAAAPDILLLDEPTEGIQPNIVEQIEEAIIALNRQFGLSVILVEQNVPFAKRAGETFLILEKGRVAASGATSDLTDAIIHRHMAV